MAMEYNQTIVVGGGLSGVSAAHTVLERGGRVLMLDKSAFCGGNSVKATSGINGAGTQTQFKNKIGDNSEEFFKDIWYSAAGADKSKAAPYELGRTLAYGSGPAVEWLQSKFNLDLSLVSRLGGHSFPRTHRGKEKFPGMTITYAQLEALEEIAKQDSNKARIITEATVTKLLHNENGVYGVEYTKGGKTFIENGNVILATGGYAADYTDTSLLKKHRPELVSFPTTNGEHCTGDGIKMAEAIGAATVDMEWVQVHPTGLVHPDDPKAKVKWLAAEALRGVGGMLIDRHGKRFCNELGTRDYVSGEMLKFDKTRGPYRLVINSKGGKEIEWHCKHYEGRKLMKHYKSGAEFAKDMGVDVAVLKETFDKYTKNATPEKDEFSKKYFDNLPFFVEDSFYVAVVCPVVHYTMGGLALNTKAQVLSKSGGIIPGLYVTGECAGGIHGKNRLGGNSLLDCVVYGRIAGDSAAEHLLNKNLSSKANSRVNTLVRQLQIQIDPTSKAIDIRIPLDGLAGTSSGAATQNSEVVSAPSSSAPTTAPVVEVAAPKSKTYTLEEVAKHTSESDCWVVVNDEVLNVTSFLSKHPGGKAVIMLYAGKDASAEFNMFHKADVVAKYAADIIIGTLAK